MKCGETLSSIHKTDIRKAQVLQLEMYGACQIVSQSCGRIGTRLLSPADELRVSPHLICSSCGKPRGPTRSIGECCSAGPRGLAAKNDCAQHAPELRPPAGWVPLTLSAPRARAVPVAVPGAVHARAADGGGTYGANSLLGPFPRGTAVAASPARGSGRIGRGSTCCTLLWGNATTAFRWKRGVCANCYHCHAKKGLLWHSHLIW